MPNDQPGEKGSQRDTDRPTLRWDPHYVPEREAPSGQVQPAIPPEPPEAHRPPPGREQPVRAMPSWEIFEEKGVVRSLLSSIGEILFRPSETFRSMPRRRELDRPLFFALIIGTVTTAMLVCVDLLSGGPIPPEEVSQSPLAAALGLDRMELSPGAIMLYSFLRVAFAPFAIAIWAFVWSGIIHLLLRFFGAAHGEIEATIRTICYILGATSPLSLLPFFGGLLTVVWATVCAAIGLREVHATTGPRAFASVVLSQLLCCACAATAIATLTLVLSLFVVSAIPGLL